MANAVVVKDVEGADIVTIISAKRSIETMRTPRQIHWRDKTSRTDTKNHKLKSKKSKIVKRQLKKEVTEGAAAEEAEEVITTRIIKSKPQ